MVRDTILLIGTEERNIDLLKEVFEGEYKIFCCTGGKEALEILTKNHKSIAAIMMDLNLSQVGGMVLLKVLNSKNITKLIPVIMYSSERDPEIISECYENGAVDYIATPFIPMVVKGRVKNLIELYISKFYLESQVSEKTGKIQEQNELLKENNDKIIEVMSNIVEFRNLESKNHIKRIKALTRILAEMVKRLYPDVYNLTDEDIEIMEKSSALHDIGKISISDTILLKPGRLTRDEFEVIKSHTTLGCEILKELEVFKEKKYMDVCYKICRHHHERYDGSGYPDNLVGEDIPIEAQIVSIVDSYEALVGDRIYRDSFDKEKAYLMIMNGECGAFSPNILNAFSKAKTICEGVCKKYSGE